jgi:hypothetical protein
MRTFFSRRQTRVIVQHNVPAPVHAAPTASGAYRLRRWQSMALAAPLMLMAEGQFPVNELAIRAAIVEASHEIHGSIGTSVATPLGRLPVKGRVAARYGCDGTFTGTVGYALLVRIGARLKGIGLVTALEGQLPPSALSQCTIAVESLSGRFDIADSTVTGSISAGADSLPIIGVLRALGDTAYHAAVVPLYGTTADSAFITFHVR